MIVHIQGADYFTNADIPSICPNASGVQIRYDYARSSGLNPDGGVIYFEPTGKWPIDLLADYNSIILGFRIESWANGITSIFKLRKNEHVQCTFLKRPFTNELCMVTGDFTVNPPTIRTGIFLPPNVSHHLEFDITIGTNSQVTIYHNGIVRYAATINTAGYEDNQNVNFVEFGGNYPYYVIDDIYVLEKLISTNSTVLKDPIVGISLPFIDDSAEWGQSTPVTDDYLLVNSATKDDSLYLYLQDSVSDKLETFHHTGVSYMGSYLTSVYGLRQIIRARNDNHSGNPDLTLVVYKFGSSPVSNNIGTISNSYAYYSAVRNGNPFGGASPFTLGGYSEGDPSLSFKPVYGFKDV